MLPSSKLMPMTIAGLVAILSLRAYALATTTPSPALLRAGAEQALVAVGATAASGMINQAHAAGTPPAAPPAPRAGTLAVNAPSLPAAAAPLHPAAFPRTDGVGGPELPALPPRAVTTPAATAPAATAPAATAPAAVTPAANAAPAEPVPAAAAPAAPAPLSVAGVGAGDRAALSDAQQPIDRASELIQREATIAAAEKRLNERVGELQMLQQRLQGLDTSLKERDGANWAGLVKLYEGMKPREAASIFNSLEKPVLIEILDRMKAAKASPILAAMDAERARQVTTELAARRTASTTAPADTTTN